MNNSPENIVAEYQAARRFKSSIGKHGLYEQGRINERFFVGDQWHGAAVGGERPLVRHNVIKRIGEYKIAQLIGSSVSVKYTAEGFSETLESKKLTEREMAELAKSKNCIYAPLKSENEISMLVSALNSYKRTTESRVKLSSVIDLALKDAFVKGTGIVYTYFDPDIKTGLYADKPFGKQILGDIVAERIKVEDVYFGDPTLSSVQNQPYIILTEEKSAAYLAAEAARFGAPKSTVNRLIAKGDGKQTVFTKLYKAPLKNGEIKVFATRVTEDTVIRPEFSMGISLYPLSVFVWERRDGCIYGDSEITYIIPNQIAINRMITASTWAAMSAGMPLMVVNGDIVSGEITNDPGQIIKVYGAGEEISSAVRFINPPDYSSGYNQSVNNLIYNTLTQCGANEAALGDLEATNTSAIIELRDAAAGYLLPLKNRFYDFVSDIATVWAEFFFTMYGKRCLKITDKNGVWYFPFDAARYKDLVLSVTATAGEGITRNEKEGIAALSKLLEQGAITPAQFVKRLPTGTVPDADELVEELKREEKKNERL
ncbi:MAG: hypothetical protein IIW94_03770 [Clostridia bacterium]|nr:hypothetical protein [Clostridia bacterium]